MSTAQTDRVVLPGMSGNIRTEEEGDSDYLRCGSDSFRSATKAWAVTPAAAQRITRNAGEVIAGRYVLKSVLGAGGMGAVYRVLDRLHSVERALKVASSNYYQSASGLLRFKQEFLAMASLKHPNLPTVLDYGVTDKGEAFLVMELEDGSALEKGRRLRLHEFYNLFVQFARALGFIHQRGFLHRDIKPANVLICPTELVPEAPRLALLDFGLMERLGAASEKIVCGTPEYLAPEVLKARLLDPRTDIYSLGITAFELLAGKLPFQHPDVKELFILHERSKRPRVGAYNDEVPQALEELILEMMAADPVNRPTSCDELLLRLATQTEFVQQSDLESRRAYLRLGDLVGREKEMLRLREGLDRAEANNAGCLLVCGQAGRGKSRLLQEIQLEALLRGFVVSGVVCREEYRSPYQTLRIVLQGFLPAALEADNLPTGTTALYQLLPAGLVPSERSAETDTLSPQAVRGQIIEEITEWFRRLSQIRPLLLMLDDLQWCDESSLVVFRALATQLRESRFMVIGAIRLDELAVGLERWRFEEGTQVMELPLFGERQITEFLERLLGENALTKSFARDALNITEGNPFFIIQALTDMIERGALVRLGGVWQSLSGNFDPPASLLPLLQRRLQRLEGLAQQIATQLAVAGGSLSVQDIVSLCDEHEETALCSIEDLLQRSIAAMKGDCVLLVHDRIREIIYEQTSPEKRCQHHQALGVLLESRLPPSSPNRAALLGHHFARGTDKLKGVNYLEAAGQAAVEQEQMGEAKDLLLEAEAVMEVAAAVPNHQRRLFVLRSMLARVGLTTDYAMGVERAEWIFQEILRQSVLAPLFALGRRLPHPMPLLWLAVTRIPFRLIMGGKAVVHQLRRDVHDLFTATAISANSAGSLGRLTTARQTACRLRAFALGPGSIAKAAETFAAAVSLANQEPPRRLLKRFQQTRQIVSGPKGREMPEDMRRLYIGGTYYMEALAYAFDQAPASKNAIEQCLRYATEKKSPFLLHLAHQVAIEYHVRSGNVYAADESEVLFRRSVLRLGGEAPQREQLVDMAMGRLDVTAGRIERALRRAEKLIRGGHGYYTEGYGCLVRAQVQLAWQNPDEAMKDAEIALRWAREQEVKAKWFEFLVLGTMAEIEILRRRPRRALRVTDEMMAATDEREHLTRYNRVEVMRRRALALATIDSGAANVQALSCLKEAAGVDCPRQLAESHATFGKVIESKGTRRSEAIIHLSEAAQLYLDLGNIYQVEELNGVIEKLKRGFSSKYDSDEPS